VTKTASCRGGAVCLPDTIIPNPVRPSESILSLAGLFLKSCCRCRRLASEGAGCYAVRRLTVQVLRVALHQICCIYCGLSRAASRSTETERGLALGGPGVNAGIRRGSGCLIYFYHFTVSSQNSDGLPLEHPTPDRDIEIKLWARLQDLQQVALPYRPYASTIQSLPSFAGPCVARTSDSECSSSRSWQEMTFPDVGAAANSGLPSTAGFAIRCPNRINGRSTR
jgi:hypothetical protein